MLSTKKLFTEHLLTLVLTLSLLRIDPDHYLDLQWGGRLARVGDAGGWQLELLAAAPDYSNQSYVSRKFLPPLIENLSRFEQPFIEQNYRGLQTYLLNVLNATEDAGSTASTIAEERPTSPVPSVGSVTTGTGHPVVAHNATVSSLTNFDVDAEDIFLSTNLFEETTSVFEQNMADLSEYDAVALEYPTLKFDAGAALPDLEGTIMRARSLMNEANKKLNVKQEDEKATTSSTTTLATVGGSSPRNGTRPDEGEEDDKKTVQQQIKNIQQKHLVSTDLDSTTEVTVKEEPIAHNDTASDTVTQDLTQEEMDLIEVLWKQDVDLGFTLTNAALSTTSQGTGTSDPASATSIKCDSEDDLEKLKVLLEIKNDKNADNEKHRDSADDSSLVDPWAGLSYTIDTETGEYVLNSSDIDNSLSTPLADLFLEEGLTLPDLGEAVEDTIAESKSSGDSEHLQQQEQADREVKRIEQELQQVSVDEICLGAASGSSSTDSSSTSGVGATALNDTDEILGSAVTDSTVNVTTSDDGLEVPPVPDDLDDLLCDMMIQTSSHFQHTRQNTQGYGHGAMTSFRQTTTGGSGYHHHHHHHHHHHQPRVPLSRAVSMEQRWQDLANLLSFPPGMGVGMGVADMPPSHPSHAHYPSHYPSYQPTGGIAGPQHGQYHHPSHAAVLQNASLADISPAQPHYGANLGSAVATSMHLTNSTSETDAGTSGYKMDPDMMYYSNSSSEMNHTDGFLNSILNDEDLQLMDIAVNEGMYTMRMLEHNGTPGGVNNSGTAAAAASGMLSGGVVPTGAASNLVNHGAHPHHHPHHHHHLSLMSAASGGGGIGGQNAMNVSALVNGTGGASSVAAATTAASGATSGGAAGDRLDASSDSAVSSMGSERVPSLSDGEWGDGGSDSAQEYHNGKYGGPYDYSYNQTTGGGPGAAAAAAGGGRLVGGGEHGGRPGPPVAQKKHHMFAKRYFQEQNTTTTGPAAMHPSSNVTGAGPGLDGSGAGGGGGGGSGAGGGGGGAGGATGGGVLLPTAIKYEYDYMNVVVGPLEGAGATGGTKQEQQDHTHPGHLQGHHGNHHNGAAAAAAAAAALTDLKYPYGIEFPRGAGNGGHHGVLQPQDMVHHNHTYTLPFATPAATGGPGAPGQPGVKVQTRDRTRSLHGGRRAEEEHLTRDEKRARALQIPIPVHDIINLPMDEFNERLSKYDLSETQLSLIRDIRRRGKNKVAAQNCRKRKLDQIVSLADEVKDMKQRKERLIRDREIVLSEHKNIRDKFSVLYRHVFQNLRDADGNPYSQEHYSLQQSADGAVVLVPRNSERPSGGGATHLNGGSSTANGGHHPTLHHPLSSATGAGHQHQQQQHHQQQQQQQQQQHHHHHGGLQHHHLTHHLQQHHGLLGGGGAAIAAGGPTGGGPLGLGAGGPVAGTSGNGNSTGGASSNGTGGPLNGTVPSVTVAHHQRTKE
ncbi:segmentation protein cap'n'collar [Anopheles nili]|uniref:segmentation protein cap'n'collar n=1 Tax=Anopheles nili TaxID=185578 RepID=UPI00237AE118|nr:segmentation protein cap'n'collar [Anopheles nili]